MSITSFLGWRTWGYNLTFPHRGGIEPFTTFWGSRSWHVMMRSVITVQCFRPRWKRTVPWVFSSVMALLSQTPGTDANKGLMSKRHFYSCYNEQVRHHKMISVHVCLGVLTPLPTNLLVTWPLSLPTKPFVPESKTTIQEFVNNEVQNLQFML